MTQSAAPFAICLFLIWAYSAVGSELCYSSSGYTKYCADYCCRNGTSIIVFCCKNCVLSVKTPSYKCKNHTIPTESPNWWERNNWWFSWGIRVIIGVGIFLISFIVFLVLVCTGKLKLNWCGHTTNRPQVRAAPVVYTNTDPNAPPSYAVAIGGTDSAASDQPKPYPVQPSSPYPVQQYGPYPVQQPAPFPTENPPSYQ